MWTFGHVSVSVPELCDGREMADGCSVVSRFVKSGWLAGERIDRPGDAVSWYRLNDKNERSVGGTTTSANRRLESVESVLVGVTMSGKCN